MRLYLVRHAQTRPDPGRPAAEWELEPAGRAALSTMAALPCFVSAGRIVSSTEPKAVLTAEAIRARHGLPPVETFAELGELHKGGWVGDNHDAVIAAAFAQPGREVAPGWEPAAEARARFTRCLERLVAESAGQDLVLVSHGLVLSLYLAALQGRSQVDPAAWRAIRMPDFAVVDPVAGSVVQGFGMWE